MSRASMSNQVIPCPGKDNKTKIQFVCDTCWAVVRLG